MGVRVQPAKPDHRPRDAPAHLSRVTLGAPVPVRIAALLPADSPRRDGENRDHVRTLVESDGPFPPILVHQPTMRVIDGMHRLRAAVVRGLDQIDVQFVDTDAAQVFLLAVEANLAHGLPLSIADRRAAARRILASHPHLSDRAVARSTGLSAGSVAGIRRGEVSEHDQPSARLGQDGRLRPIDMIRGRERAYEVITGRPTASLREIARQAGISLGTARDVRARVQRGADPVPARLRSARERSSPDPADAGPSPAGAVPLGTARADRNADPYVLPAARPTASMLTQLHRDPALRFSDRGRWLLRWLDRALVLPTDLATAGAAVPPHLAEVVAEAARACAANWLLLADRLTDRTRHHHSDPGH
jgi:ParB-like chromosome segregation protein Spo0J